MTIIEEENYKKLLDSFRKRRVILFIGAGSSRGMGLPNWEELLRGIECIFHKNSESKLSTEQKEIIKRLFECQKLYSWKTQKLYSEIAKVFQEADGSLYETALRSLLQLKDIVDAAPKECLKHQGHSEFLIHQRYLQNLLKLPINGIITTNYDLVLERTLENLRIVGGWESFTWKDVNDWETIDKFTEKKHFIFHLHGRIDEFHSVIHTNTEYESLYDNLHGNENIKVRTFSNLLFALNTVLFIGYRLGDPIIPQIKRFISDSFRLTPSWYQLIPKCEWQPDCVRDAGEPVQLTYQVENRNYTTGLSQWIEKLGKDINIHGISCKFTIMATREAMNSIVFHGLTQYIESRYGASYEVFDSIGISSSRDWMEYQVVSSVAIIIIRDTTVRRERLDGWLAEITRCCHLKLDVFDNIIIYQSGKNSEDKKFNDGIKFASNCSELESFVDSVISNKLKK